MRSTKKLKIAAALLALIPVGFFLLFAVGVGFEGWPHYVEAAIFLAPPLFAWKEPRVGGYLLLLLGVLSGVAYAVMASNMPLLTILEVECIIFVPTICAGCLFLLASRQQDPSRR
jgi:hypothetical protein